MKKHILFCLVAMWSVLYVSAINVTNNLNPFAYNLSATLNKNQTITIKYCLNANARTVTVVFLDGETIVKSVSCSGLTKTTPTTPHGIDISTAEFEVGKKISWRIDVQGNGRAEHQLYSTSYAFDMPSSVDIVKDPTSHNYGKVIVVEGSHASYNKSSLHSKDKGAGLYVFYPDMTPIPDKNGKYGRNGGTKTWGSGATSEKIFANTSYAPRRVRVSEDGRIFVSSMHQYTGTKQAYIHGDILWEVDENFSEWTTVIGEGVGGATYDITKISADGKTYYKNQLLTSGGAYIAAPNAGLDVRGSGENLKLLLLSTDYRGFAGNAAGFSLNEYDLGEKTTWSEAPSKSFNVTTADKEVFAHALTSNVLYDKNGGIWCVSFRSECKYDQPGLVLMNESGVEKCRQLRSGTQNAGLRFNKDFTRAIMSTAGSIGMLYTYDPTSAANTDEVGYFFHEDPIDMSAVGPYLNDFAWDNANNIYAVGQKTYTGTEADGHVAVYCLEYDKNDVFTTPGPESFTIAGAAWDPSTPAVGSASKYEFRGVWTATVTNIDWPSEGTKGNVEEQKQELIDILDRLQAGNINAVCLQVRSLCDALYESSYEPWSAALMGTRGTGPGYDPLQFAIEEAHKRGMELHAWVNPFRVTSEKLKTGSMPYAALPSTDKLYTANKLLSGKIIEYRNTTDAGTKYGQILDPGYPEVRDHIVEVLMEIVNNYDIDGLLMDDYFYPSVDAAIKNTYDSGSQNLYYDENSIDDFNEDGSKLDDWRRQNVDKVIEELSKQMREKKPWVRFGMGPFGIWAHPEYKAHQKYGLEHPQGIIGANYYTDHGCNTMEWIKQGWVDYVNPQLYWPTTSTGQDYNVLYEWWSNVCEKLSNEFVNPLYANQKVQFYPSHAADRVYSDGHKWGVGEMRLQVDQNRSKMTNGYSGSVYYSARYYLNLNNYVGAQDSTLCQKLRASHYQMKALVPPMAWKSNEVLEAPNTLRISGNRLTWQHNSAERYTVYIYPKGIEMEEAMKESAYLQMVVYGNSFALPASFDVEKQNVAVCSYDRYGVEHYATEYEAPLPDVTYVLNGGELGNRTVVSKPNVPTQEELIAAFKTGYNSYFGASVKTTREITNFLYAGSAASDGGNKCDVSKMMTDVNSGWKWLGDYIIAKAGTPNGTIEYWWRRNVGGFFIQGIYAVASVNSFDFSTAGKPSAWGPAYQEAHKTTTTFPLTLPEKIEGSAFTLPIAGEITHPSGCNFLGWFNNPDMTGTALTTLHVGYKGTVYAKWDGIITWILNGGKYTGEGTLPTTVDAKYTLPTAADMERVAYVFGGWYEDAAFIGDALTTIEAGYKGVLHARWIPAHHVTWHPYHCGDMRNEDLWKLFMEDYNEWYYTKLGILPQPRADQPITNAIGFTFPPEETREDYPAYENGMAKEFLQGDPRWQWLDEYINKVIDEENESLDSNAPLWTAFKEATGLTHLGALSDITITTICSTGALDNNNEQGNADGKNGGEILTELFKKEEWQWLKDYIKVEQNKFKNVVVGQTDDGKDIKIQELTDDVTNRAWAYAVAAFFKRSQQKTWPATADFFTAGKHSVWKNSMPEKYHHEMAHFHVTSELEYRKNLHAFFNHSNVVTYPVSGGTKTEGTADFTVKGQPKPNGDPNAGWYSTWSKATFPEYIAAGQDLPKVRRDGYVFAGWCCGNAAGYYYNTRMFGSYDETMEGKNHLWARWIELCLYEGYAEKDVHSLQEPDKVNHNVELAQYADGTDTGKSHKIAIHRNFISDGKSYSTLVLPFAIARDKDGAKSFIAKITDADGNAIFDENTLPSILKFIGAEVVEGGVNGEDMVNFVFEEQDLERRPIEGEEDKTVIPPYTPFLFRSPVPMPTWTQWWAAFIHDEGRFSQPQMGANGLMFKRVFEPSVVEAPTEGAVGLILVDKNRLAKVTKAGEMLGLRGYFIYEGEAANMPSNITIRQETTTDVYEVKNVSATEMQVEKILRNGHIYILRDGKTYTIMGARVE